MFNDLENFYKNKTVLVTGHTGFKGSWISIWLNKMGAKLIGYSKDIKTKKDNFVLSNLQEKMIDERGDIADFNKLNSVIQKYKPEIVFHLAAQALVKYSYMEPIETYMTNVIGTLNLLEACKNEPSVKQIVVITTDKCYENNEWEWGYREIDALGGYDPYSSSKACVEIMIKSYRNSFFNIKDYDVHKKAVATVRAGNVIGGGDWSQNRIIPDCIRKLEENEKITIRNPSSTRPWQHVLEPIGGYLLLGYKLSQDYAKYSTSFNFGPEYANTKQVKDVVTNVIKYYGKGEYEIKQEDNSSHEAKSLGLDISKAKFMLGWSPVWDIDMAVQKTVEWYKDYKTKDAYEICLEQIEQYEGECK